MTGTGEVTAFFWTLNDPPGLQGLMNHPHVQSAKKVLSHFSESFRRYIRYTSFDERNEMKSYDRTSLADRTCEAGVI